ncbi:MAG: ATP-binding cassette domain-containing protein [Clostridia bacterium]|nr:ATP-binding cassette domain-containing protein [Clostridia bacterium]
MGANEVNALCGVSININRGDIFGIIGMSGAGKSTLVRCINFLEKPTTGTVIIDGEDLSQLSEKDLRKKRQEMGMIFQQFNLLMQSNVMQNIHFPMEIAGFPKDKIKERTAELLEIVGLADKANAYPAQLSGGQKQRVAIARALATSPKLMLCDEATSALDPTTTRSILSLLKDINNRLGITIVIITHEMAVIEEICSHVAIIDNGLIAEMGPVGEIFSRPKSAAAQKLVFPTGKKMAEAAGGKLCRVVFDGSATYQPIISTIALEFRAQINIIYANVKEIEGKSFGEMVLRLPPDEQLSEKMIRYLRALDLTVEEVSDYAD